MPAALLPKMAAKDLVSEPRAQAALLQAIDQPLLAGPDGLAPARRSRSGQPATALIPALLPSALGDPAFTAAHGLRFPLMGGSMANGIASVAFVCALAKAGMLGSYGAGGQGLDSVATAIARIRTTIGASPFAINLIHSPHEPAHEEALVNLLIAQEVRLVEASAYLDLTPAVVRYRLHGIHEVDGRVITPHRIIAKASRVEVARRWLNPPPARLLTLLRERGDLTADQARLAERIPMAHDLTAEADSGGHTDQRAFIALLPTFLALAEAIQAERCYDEAPRIGAAGGISTPSAVCAASTMGASYIVTGSINQACVESGSCQHVRDLLATVDQADICLAPAADMFELGVKLQVVKRGTLFPMRAQKLYDLYSTYGSWAAVPAPEQAKVEQQIFRRSYAAVWQDTETFWESREPAQAARARQDPKRQFALCCRWYLGLSSIWANRGVAERQLDYQIWAGPAMGAFNQWCQGSFLADPAQRQVATVARNLLWGAAVLQRINIARAQGIRLSAAARRVSPQPDTVLRVFFPDDTRNDSASSGAGAGPLNEGAAGKGAAGTGTGGSGPDE